MASENTTFWITKPPRPLQRRLYEAAGCVSHRHRRLAVCVVPGVALCGIGRHGGLPGRGIAPVVALRRLYEAAGCVCVVPGVALCGVGRHGGLPGRGIAPVVVLRRLYEAAGCVCVVPGVALCSVGRHGGLPWRGIAPVVVLRRLYEAAGCVCVVPIIRVKLLIVQASEASSSRLAPPTPEFELELGVNQPVPLQTSISILGVEVNSVLTFTDHIRTIARKAAWKLSCVRRVSHLLDSQGITTLYAAQVRSLMEYAPLTWSSCPPSYLSLLDKVQARAQRLIRLKALQDQLLPPLQPLQQRRDVAGLCVVYKTHKQHVPHLAALRQPWARPHGHTTRTAATKDHQLIVPFARTETSLRSFLPRYTRMWNRMVQQTQLHSTSSLQTFKSAVNAWIKQP
ncbi:hypothetical protein GWK47_044984 [Chionoecetes opilio]|uniref:Uncharacterized protein n=1 Tax=Chionoecetes opilio TaxID=41210 RepID=A0A8J4Y7M4_CHIOP|nr:hypothetical protein GWK47_044984 [Chionoecetes opilio]